MSIEQLQKAVDDLAASLRRSVVIDDSSVHLVVASRHFGDEDEVRVRAMLQREGADRALGHVLAQGVTHWTTAGVIPPVPEIGMKSRVCMPIRWRAELLGLLIVMDADSTVTEEELRQISAAAADMSALLREMLQDEDVGGEDALWALISPRNIVRRQALSEIADRRDLKQFAPLVAVHLSAIEGEEATRGLGNTALAGGLRAEARDDPAGMLYAVRNSTAMILLGLGRASSRDRLASRVNRMVTKINDLSAQRLRWVGGIGGTVDGLDLAAESAEQAGVASSAARRLVPNPVVFWDELGALASLLRIPPNGRTRNSLPDEVRRLLEIDGDGQLTATVRAFLDHGGSSTDAAAALHIHRTTLYYRLGRVEELAGLDFADGRTRLALHVGLELMRIDEALRDR